MNIYIDLRHKSFVSKALTVHNNQYDYSKVEYRGIHEKVNITCLKCNNVFYQSPASHLQGSGCPICFRRRRHIQEPLDSKTIRFNSFVQKSREAFGDVFIYCLDSFVNHRTKTKIICKSCHHEWLVRPTNHYKSKGCPRCNSRLKIISMISNDLYDYSYSIYRGQHSKIDILCKTCGQIFKTTPHNHFRFHGGCNFCRSSGPEKEWLDNCGVDIRQHLIYINNRKIWVDGFDPETNTIYEFHGDFWHGNPEKFNPDDINVVSGKKFGELYTKTLERTALLKQLGYVVIEMWESQWRTSKRL